MVSQQIAAHIDSESLRASRDLAIELGEPEWCVGTGLRNTHRIAIPPTK
jgi:ribonucleoside-diphosphate reductase alpha chain